MHIWEVEEDHLIDLVYEISRLGQSLLRFGEEAYGPYFSSRLAEIILSMLGLDGASSETAGENGISGDGVKGFDAGPYSYLFNSEVFLNENLLGEILAGIRENSKGFYKTKAQIAETGTSVVWKIDERLILDLIKEVKLLGREMAGLKDDAWSEYFSTTIPEIILKMLGTPESYCAANREDLFKEDKPRHPAEYDGSYDYDIFNYTMSDESMKKFLDYKRKHQDEYRQIRTEQAKLGDKLHEPDAYDAFYDELVKFAKNQKS